MGKVEKVIVLSVLFLIALILAVSLTMDDPLNKERVVEAGKPDRKAVTPEQLASNGTSAPAPLLSATVTPTDAPASGAAPAAGNALVPSATPATTPAPIAAANVPAPTPAVVTPTAATPNGEVAVPTLPPGALLKRLDGLEDSLMSDWKLYTWKEGDDLAKVAQYYYGDRNKFTVLRRSNEGRTEIRPGEKIFVPVFDASGAATTVAAPEAGGKTAKGGKGTKAAPAVDAGKKVHVVQEGESLWKIAKSELGDGNRWKEIYEINKDVLAKPESVKKGMRLRIP